MGKWTATQLLASTKKLASWRETGYSSSETMKLEETIPFRGMRAVVYHWKHLSKDRKVWYDTYIEVQEVEFGDSIVDSRTWTEVEYKGQKYFFEKPNISVNPIRIRCSCFTGDTQVVLESGEIKRLKELEGAENFKIFGYNQISRKFETVTALKCEKKNDNAEIVQVTLDNGKSIRCTPEHRFLTKDGVFTEAKDLVSNTSLRALYYDKEANTQLNPEGKYLVREFNSREDYYVYVYLDPRKPGQYVYGEYEFPYEPYYVGKGRDHRDVSHLTRCGSEWLKRKNAKIQKEGLEPIILRHVCGLYEPAALEVEKKLIRAIGRKGKGPLVNHTDGGEGTSGFDPTPYVEERLRTENPMWNEKAKAKSIETNRKRGYYLKASEHFSTNNPMKNDEFKAKAIATNFERGNYSSERMQEVSNSRTEDTFRKIIQSREANDPDCYKKFNEAGARASRKLLSEGNHYLQSEAHRTQTREQFQNPEHQRNLCIKKAAKHLALVLKTFGEITESNYASCRQPSWMYWKTLQKKEWFSEAQEVAEQKAFYNHKVVSVKILDHTEAVYCITTEHLGNFVVFTPDSKSELISGVVVENCPDFRFRGSFQAYNEHILYGGKFPAYQRKTPAPPVGRPLANADPHGVMMCKHLYNSMVRSQTMQYWQQLRFY